MDITPKTAPDAPTSRHLDLASDIITTAVESPYLDDFSTTEKYEWGWRGIGNDQYDEFDGTKVGISVLRGLPEQRNYAEVALVEVDFDPRAGHPQGMEIYPRHIAHAMRAVTDQVKQSMDIASERFGLAPEHLMQISKAWIDPESDENDFDAIDAMNLIQIAWFGKVIYG